MRFEHLAVQAGDEELGMAFHERLTIVSGLGHAERREMVELLLASLVGGRREASLLRYVDSTGRRALVDADGHGQVKHVFEDGTPAPDPLAPLALDLAALRRLAHVKGTDMDRLAAAGGAVPPELEEARRALAQLTEELDAADEAQRELEELRFGLAAVDEQLRDVTSGAPRRQFARLVLHLQQVQAEADLVNEQIGLADTDGDHVASAPEVRRLTARWEAATARAEELRRRFDDGTRLDADALAQALTIPDVAPAELPGLTAALQWAEDARRELEAQLPAPTSGRRQRRPSNPAVPELARADQDALWRAARAAQAADQRVNDASLALGGLEAGGITPTIVEELDDAQDELEEAEAAVARVRGLTRVAAIAAGVLTLGCLIVLLGGVGPTIAGLPAFPVVAGAAILATAGSVGWLKTAPQRRLANARVRVEAALKTAGVPTYLAFHMRRIDPTLDKNAGQSLELAQADQRRAATRWTALAGDITPEAALALEDEVRSHAAALRQLDGDGSDEIRRNLVDVAEPTLERARAAVLAACAPFGITDPTHADEEVERRVQLGTTARLQAGLEEAETAAAASVSALTTVLDPLGFTGPASLGERVRSFEIACADAEARQQARSQARPRDEVLADLVRLEAEVRLQARPGWAMEATPADAAEPDIEFLQRRRTEMYAACAATERRVPDVHRLRDRCETIERRVAILEAETGLGSARGQAEPALVEEHLLGRLAQVRRNGADEAMPLLLDEPFIGAADQRVDGLLDMVDRLSSRVQLIFLTDDERVVTWARARQAAGTFALLEPTPETV